MRCRRRSGVPPCCSSSSRLGEQLATSSPPTAELPLEGKLEGVRAFPNSIKLLERAEGVLHFRPTAGTFTPSQAAQPPHIALISSATPNG